MDVMEFMFVFAKFTDMLKPLFSWQQSHNYNTDNPRSLPVYDPLSLVLLPLLKSQSCNLISFTNVVFFSRVIRCILVRILQIFLWS